MTNQQINQYDMYLRVQKVMHGYQHVWSSNNRITANFTEFEKAVQTIDEYQQKKGNGNGNLFQSKTELKKQLIETTLRVVKAVQSFAVDEKNTELYASLNYSKSDLLQLRESQLPMTCRIVHDKSVLHLPQLAEYGVTEALLTRLRNLTEQFKARVPETQVAISQGKATTESLAELFKKTSALLRDQLDGKLEQFIDTHISFHSAYFKARAIIDRTKTNKTEEKKAA